jgi:hypothetical protein
MCLYSLRFHFAVNETDRKVHVPLRYNSRQLGLSDFRLGKNGPDSQRQSCVALRYTSRHELQRNKWKCPTMSARLHTIIKEMYSQPSRHLRQLEGTWAPESTVRQWLTEYSAVIFVCLFYVLLQPVSLGQIERCQYLNLLGELILVPIDSAWHLIGIY